jgi:hypothetical protein
MAMHRNAQLMVIVMMASGAQARKPVKIPHVFLESLPVMMIIYVPLTRAMKPMTSVS